MHSNQTREQLLNEVDQLQRKISELQSACSDCKRAEEALRESEAKWRSLAENSPDFIYMADSDGKVLFMNRTYPEHPEDEVIGKSIYDFLAPEYHNGMRERLESIFQNGCADPLESGMLRRDGTYAFFQTRYVAIEHGGKIASFMGIATDITERRRAEEALRNSRYMLQTVLDSIPAAVFWKDRDSIYVSGNRTWLEVVGLKSSEEVVGKSDYDLPWEKEQADSFREYDRRVMESGIPEYDIIEPYLQADDTQAWARTNKVPLRDAEGNVVGVLGTYEDITESKRAEEELRKAHDELELRVKERTAELEAANQQLAREIEERKKTEEELREYEDYLKELVEERTAELKEANIQLELRITERRQAEEALRRSEEKYRLVSENIPVAVYSAAPDEQSTTIFISGRIEELTGYTAEEFLGDPGVYDRVLHPEDRQYVWEKIEEHRRERTPLDVEYRIITKEGVAKWIHDRATPMLDESGEIAQINGFMEDITDRKRAEIKHQTIVKTALDGFCITDLDGRLLEVNDSYCRMVGYTREELLGMCVQDMEAAEDPDEILRHLIRISEQGSDRFETRHKHKDGEVIDVEVSVNYLDVGEGQVFVFLRDVTERRQAEDELRMLSARNEAILAAVPDIIMEVDDNKVYTWANKAGLEFFGDDVLGEEASYYFEGEQEVYSAVQPLFEGDEDVIYVRSWQRRKDGQKRLLAWWCRVLKDAQGKATGALSSARDITDLVRAEQALQASLREKEVLLREIHHRVKNNLQTISSLLDLEAESIQDQQTLQMFQDIQNRVRSMALIHEKLYQSRELAKIDIAGYIEKLVGDLVEAYGGRPYVVTPNIRVDDLSLNIDTAVPCGLIVCELVSNALKHAFRPGERGEVRVDFRSENDTLYRLRVTDNGVGLPQDLDVHKPPSLGLQLVNMLTRQLKGTVELDRSVGTSFEITFEEQEASKGARK